jgi:hypothetical protein
MRRRKLIPVLLLLAATVLAGALFLFPGGPAEAGFTSESTEDLVDYVKSDAALNLRLMALDAIRKKSESGIETELEKIAKGKDTVIAVYACTTLGRKKSSKAKTALQAIVEDTKLGKEVRKGAMSAIAVHWKSSSDLTWLQSKTSSDSVRNA